MSYGFTRPAYWGSKSPGHWGSQTIYTWRLSEIELNGVTLSQCGQDCVVWWISQLCNYARPPLYLDIGANDGHQGSSTIGLENEGWNGLLVEPNPLLHQSISQHRAAKALCVAVGTDLSVSDLHTSNVHHKLGTLDLDPYGYQRQRLQLEVSGPIPAEIIKIPVAIVKLGVIIDYFVRTFGSTPDFIKIDAEGSEEEIVDSIIELTIRPSIIEIENNLRDESVGNRLIEYGYHCLCVMDSFVEIWTDCSRFSLELALKQLVYKLSAYPALPQ